MPADQDVRSIAELLRDLAEGSGRHVRQEVRLARAEAADSARGVAVGSALVATGAVFALLGTFALLTGLVLLIGDQWLRDNYWLAAVIVMGVAGALAAFAARRGLTLLSPAHLAPTKRWRRSRRTSNG